MPDMDQTFEERRRWYVPRSFTVGAGTKVHLGTQRKDEIILLACGMSGYIGSPWLVPTDDPLEEITCGHCLRATR